MKENLCEFSGKTFKDQVRCNSNLFSFYSDHAELAEHLFCTERGGCVSPGQTGKTSGSRAEVHVGGSRLGAQWKTGSISTKFFDPVLAVLNGEVAARAG
jgi:hypothetical protein